MRGIPADSVVGAGHGTQDGTRGVRVAPQVDDLGQSFLEAVGGQEEIEAGRDAGRWKTHRRPLARRVCAVSVGFLHERREDSIAGLVKDGFDVGHCLREGFCMTIAGYDHITEQVGDSVLVAGNVGGDPEQEAWFSRIACGKATNGMGNHQRSADAADVAMGHDAG